jgi:hypothetical protein
MRVGFDSAGGDDLARRVDDAGPVGGQRAGRRHHRDLLAGNPDVPKANALRRDDLPVADQKIEHERSLAQVTRAVNDRPRDPPGKTACAIR